MAGRHPGEPHEAAKVVRQLTAAAEFAARDVLYSADLRKFAVIGEAVKRLSPGLTSQESHVSWRELAGFRDVLVHNYFGIRDTVVWDAVMNVAPRVREDILKIVERVALL